MNREKLRQTEAGREKKRQGLSECWVLPGRLLPLQKPPVATKVGLETGLCVSQGGPKVQQLVHRLACTAGQKLRGMLRQAKGRNSEA